MPYFTLDILRAKKRRMTAMIDMVHTTEMDAAASAHRLSLSEGTSLTQSWGIVAKVSIFCFANQFKISSRHVGDAKRIQVLPVSWMIKKKPKIKKLYSPPMSWGRQTKVRGLDRSKPMKANSYSVQTQPKLRPQVVALTTSNTVSCFLGGLNVNIYVPRCGICSGRLTAHNGSAARTARVWAIASVMISSRQVVEESSWDGKAYYFNRYGPPPSPCLVLFHLPIIMCGYSLDAFCSGVKLWWPTPVSTGIDHGDEDDIVQYIWIMVVAVKTSWAQFHPKSFFHLSLMTAGSVMVLWSVSVRVYHVYFNT